MLDGMIVGSYIYLLDGVKKCVEFGINFDDAVRAANAINLSINRFSFN